MERKIGFSELHWSIKLAVVGGWILFFYIVLAILIGFILAFAGAM